MHFGHDVLLPIFIFRSVFPDAVPIYGRASDGYEVYSDEMRAERDK